MTYVVALARQKSVLAALPSAERTATAARFAVLNRGSAANRECIDEPKRHLRNRLRELELLGELDLAARESLATWIADAKLARGNNSGADVVTADHTIAGYLPRHLVGRSDDANAIILATKPTRIAAKPPKSKSSRRRLPLPAGFVHTDQRIADADQALTDLLARLPKGH